MNWSFRLSASKLSSHASFLCCALFLEPNSSLYTNTLGELHCIQNLYLLPMCYVHVSSVWDCCVSLFVRSFHNTSCTIPVTKSPVIRNVQEISVRDVLQRPPASLAKLRGDMSHTLHVTTSGAPADSCFAVQNALSYTCSTASSQSNNSVINAVTHLHDGF